MRSETIAAISTALADSGIGIVRISGEEAIEVADRIFHMPSGISLRECRSHTIHYGHIYEENRIVDEVLVMLMRAPHSFTTEDTVEINCHGGLYVVKKVLESALKNGARLAEPGEFTKRAFLGGRMDLSQAEAVMELIRSQNDYALEASVRQLKGDVSEAVRDMREQILYQIAYIESALDDPEHISLDGYPKELYERLDELTNKMESLIASFEDGRQMTEGIKTVILGKPNAGKSSLLNLLTGEERAIVTDVAGTTRDVLEERILLNGISLRLLDTAGIHSTKDRVEQIGIRKAYEQAEDADLILYVADSLSGIDGDDRTIWKEIKGKNVILLINKTDLKQVGEQKIQEVREAAKKELCSAETIEFSALTKKGLRELTDTIYDLFFAGKISFNDQIYITNIRHRDLLMEARKSLRLVGESICQGMPEDFYSIDLMDAYEKLGQIIGEETGEDLVNEIFSRFCMGK
ncbi:MAG: tRNA uridine-5-carboxymethylaminomethyl(34) synthesis GTPase MnmE [Lachnospiraceae bacterium]|jgi:tRNA modification GTPase|nr:tRNA uridine-5-carboxymethylaminomethyl(34) synthesis GTPase MnmE [Lachnospiraceae bacterium]